MIIENKLNWKLKVKLRNDESDEEVKSLVVLGGQKICETLAERKWLGRLSQLGKLSMGLPQR